MQNTIFKIISLIVIIAILWIGFITYNFFYPIKFVEKSKAKIEFIEIGNPFGDNHYYYQVEKYIYSKKEWAIGFGGGNSYSQDYHAFGLADINKQIIVKPEQYTYYSFHKTIGYNKNGILDTVNLIRYRIYKNSKETTTFLTQYGNVFNSKSHFGSNPVILMNANSSNNYGCLYDLKRSLCVSNYYKITWINPNALLISKTDITSKDKKEHYGALSVNGKIIIPLNKYSKEEILNLINIEN